MIRVLVLALLAANLFFLGLSRWVSEEEPRLVAPPPVPPNSRPAPPVAVSTPAAPAPCTSLGPERDETRALEIEQQLRDMQLLPSRRSVVEDVREGWWVFVVNADAAAQARTLRVIHNAGMRDAFAMQDDPEFRVSVGLFMEETGARSTADAVQALKLNASVNERMQQHTSMWFDLPGTARNALDLARLEGEGIDVQALRLEECPAGAAAPVEAVPTENPAPATESGTPPQV